DSTTHRPNDPMTSDSITNDFAERTGEDRIYVIQPIRGWRLLDLRELWAYRELIYFLTWRDIKVRYKQTALGVAWAVLQPLALMAIFTLLFSRLAKIPSEGIPYPLFAYAGLLPWQIFSRTLNETTASLVKDHRLVAKVYFPRVIIPLSTTLAAMFDFMIASGVLVILMVIYGVAPGPALMSLPFFVVIMFVTALGIGLWLSALNVQYRDVGFTVPFLTQSLLFLTPVVYPSSMVPEKFRMIYALNPMVGVIEGFRWSLFGVGKGLSLMFPVSVLIALGLFLGGIVWFRSKEKGFVDILGA
ncbi:MAG: ABC transporter permease, partial [Desulfobacterales bacterium]|nr:ABC transporter permease [Desulfobacterales bacterium]